MAYRFFIAISGIYPCAYCGTMTKQRPVICEDYENAYPPCCLSCIELNRWRPEYATCEEAVAILEHCDERSRMTARTQAAYSAIAEVRGWNVCNSFNGGTG